ncbi:hypothetical protein IFR05_017373, partial [Cadophora sp. M221]
TLDFALVGKDLIVAAAVGIVGFSLDRTPDDMVDPALRGVVMDSHCALHQLRVAYTVVVVRLTGPFSPSGLFVLHMVVLEAAGLEELVVGEDGQEDRSDIHAKDQSLVYEGPDGRTANVLRVDGDQLDMVQTVVVAAVERMEFDLDLDDVGTVAAAAAH